MDIADYIRCVASEGDRFAAAADAGSLEADIAACDGWNMRSLVRHLGLIHLWAAAHVAFSSDEWLDSSDDIPALSRYWPDLAASWPGDTDLVAWYRRTNENLVRVLRSMPDDHDCMTFLPAPNALTMWSRRQASEIAIHRFDAEHARGLPSHFEPEFATDMLDELLSGFASRPRADGAEDIAVEAEQVLHVHAEDVDEHWFLTIGREAIETTRIGGDADLRVSASAAELYLLMWNRTDASTVTLTGDPHVMDTWRESCRVRWPGGE